MSRVPKRFLCLGGERVTIEDNLDAPRLRSSHKKIENLDRTEAVKVRVQRRVKRVGYASRVEHLRGIGYPDYIEAEALHLVEH